MNKMSLSNSADALVNKYKKNYGNDCLIVEGSGKCLSLMNTDEHECVVFMCYYRFCELDMRDAKKVVFIIHPDTPASRNIYDSTSQIYFALKGCKLDEFIIDSSLVDEEMVIRAVTATFKSVKSTTKTIIRK